MPEPPSQHYTPNLEPASLVDGGRFEEPQMLAATDLETIHAFGASNPVTDLIRTRIEHGQTKTNKLAWYRVTFASRFSSTPNILATARHRSGWFNEMQIQPLRLDSNDVGRRFGIAVYNWIVDNVHAGWMDDAVRAIGYSTGYLIGWIQTGIFNIVLNALAQHITFALNKGPALLYAGSDRPTMKLTTAEVRSVSTTSFEILGYPDGTIDWLAIGAR